MTGSRPGTERELKLGVWPEFEPPDLESVVKRGEMGPQVERRLDAVYFDTSDLRLLRRGVTLRFRRGEDAGPLWTVKLPEEAPALGWLGGRSRGPGPRGRCRSSCATSHAGGRIS
jgi:hypothetical protein